MAVESGHRAVPGLPGAPGGCLVPAWLVPARTAVCAGEDSDENISVSGSRLGPGSGRTVLKSLARTELHHFVFWPRS